MANISIQIGTDTPTLTVSIDGQSIPNVDDISVYNYRDSDGNVAVVSATIYTREVMQNGIVKVVNYYAYGTAEATAALASSNELDTETIPGFVGVRQEDDNSKAHQDIQSFFQAKKR